MDDRSAQVFGVAFTFLILTWVTVGLRCYVRLFMVKAFGLDDKVMVATLLTFTAYLGCQIGGAVHGTGQRRERLSDASAQTALRYWFFCEIFYTITTSLLKLAVGLFLLRITTVKYHRWIIWIIMAVAGFLGVGYTLLVLFQCNPVSYWWDLNETHQGKCISASLVMIFTYIVSGLNSFADWTFGILPIFIVKDLQMKRRLKVVVAGVIALAAIGSTATIIRLPYTGSLKPYKGDFLYRTTDFAIWTTVEVGVGITAGCMATLRPLVKSTLPSFGTGPSGSSSGTGLPWSKFSKHSRGVSRLHMQPLDDMKPNTMGKGSGTTTTVTGGRLSSESDEEQFLGSGNSTGKAGVTGNGMGMGISKNVTTTVVEERREVRIPPGSFGASGTVTGRHGSADSSSTLGHEDEGRGGATKPYERF